MSPIGALPLAPTGPGGPGLPGKGSSQTLAQFHLEALVKLGRGQHILLLTWEAWRTSFTRRAWRRTPWAARVSTLPFESRCSHWTRWTHFMQAFRGKNSINSPSLLSLSPHGTSQQECGREVTAARSPIAMVRLQMAQTVTELPLLAYDLPATGLISFVTISQIYKKHLSNNTNSTMSTVKTKRIHQSILMDKLLGNLSQKLA